jgi:RNA polymerase sigma-70 factor (ECF subfamily)
MPAADFPAFYREHARRVLLFFAKRTIDAEAARDLTAETFAQAFEHRRRVRGKTSEEAAAWLFGIARHQLSRYQRRGLANTAAVERLGLQLPPVTEDDAERILELAGLARLRTEFANAFSRLKPDDRLALQLRVLDERSYPDVARELGVREPAARARVSRALRRLGDVLARPTSPEGTP